MKNIAVEIKELEHRLAVLRKAEALLREDKPAAPAKSPGKRRNGGHRAKCVECGRGFIAHTNHTQCCSPRCYNRRWWREFGSKRNAERNAKAEEKRKAQEKAEKRGTVLIPGAQK